MTKERLPRRAVGVKAGQLTRMASQCASDLGKRFYGKGDTPGHTWLHGGDPTGKPGYVKGMQGQQKKTRKWPY